MNTISFFFVLSGVVSAAIMFFDIYLAGNRQRMSVMNIVWVLTGLWAGPFALMAYYSFGRVKPVSKGKMGMGSVLPIDKPATKAPSMSMDDGMKMDMSADMPMDKPTAKTPSMSMDDGMKMDMSADMPMDKPATKTPSMPMDDGMKMDMSADMPMDKPATKTPSMSMDDGMKMDMSMPSRPMVQKVVLSALHCGAGCTLADIIGEWFILLVPMSLIAGWALDYVLALLIGVAFQYAAIRTMENISRAKGYEKALKVDFWSLTSWQVGMYGWMAIVIFVFDMPIDRLSWSFWFMMQVAMMCGFLTAYPTNWVLIKMGIKKGM